MRLFIIAFSLLNYLPFGSLQAEESEGEPSVSVSLLTPATRFDSTFTVVLRFTFSPDWYLYWTNPGDAGLSPSVRWSLPAGFRSGELRFPTPQKIVHDAAVAYGYRNELVLLTTLRPPLGYVVKRGDTISADLDWLICSGRCLPGRGRATLALENPGQGRGEAAAAMERFTRGAPREIEELGIAPPTGTIRTGERGLLLSIPLPVVADDFYPEVIDRAVIGHSGIVVDREGIRIPVSPYEKSETIRSVSGLVIIGETAYRLNAPVVYEK